MILFKCHLIFFENKKAFFDLIIVSPVWQSRGGLLFFDLDIRYAFGKEKALMIYIPFDINIKAMTIVN